MECPQTPPEGQGALFPACVPKKSDGWGESGESKHFGHKPFPQGHPSQDDFPAGAVNNLRIVSVQVDLSPSMWAQAGEVDEENQRVDVL